MTTTSHLHASPTAAGRAAPARLDLYTPAHKGLRLFMSDTLTRVGALDVSDVDELGQTLAQVHSLLDLCRRHLDHESQFLHTALEARRPGATVRIAAEHDEHIDAIAALEADAAALRALPGAAAAHRFYRHLALFVAENLEHMNLEETAHNAALWADYSDAELAEVHQRLLASIDPAEMALALRWMVPALTPTERAAMFASMQQRMTPDALRRALEIVRPHLNASAWGKLTRALGSAGTGHG